MISFVVIGKNIEKTIKTCLDSIYETIKFNKIINYEVILLILNQVTKHFQLPKNLIKLIFIKLNKPNAAIARNLGFTKSKGQYVFYRW